MPAQNLPEWATDTGTTHGALPVYEVDCDKAYSSMLQALGVAEDDVDQYWLEVAYQCLKMDMQVACGMNCEFHFRDSKKKWAQANYPEGKGAALATQGRHAREHYKRLRGFIPS